MFMPPLNRWSEWKSLVITPKVLELAKVPRLLHQLPFAGSTVTAVHRTLRLGGAHYRGAPAILHPING
jgi:hypothetical protein